MLPQLLTAHRVRSHIAATLCQHLTQTVHDRMLNRLNEFRAIPFGPWLKNEGHSVVILQCIITAVLRGSEA